MIASSSTPAIDVRAAIRVTGGIVATPSLMKVYDPPHSVASSKQQREFDGDGGRFAPTGLAAPRSCCPPDSQSAGCRKQAFPPVLEMHQMGRRRNNDVGLFPCAERIISHAASASLAKIIPRAAHDQRRRHDAAWIIGEFP